jgi:ABC-type multidrug transport system ATPase subunit
LLLLDEPSTGLDPGRRIQLWDAIRQLVASGTDVLLTTQYLDEAAPTTWWRTSSSSITAR